MTDIFEEVYYEKDPVILESEEKAALKVLRRNKSLGVECIATELIQATEIESVKILTRIC